MLTHLLHNLTDRAIHIFGNFPFSRQKCHKTGFEICGTLYERLNHAIPSFRTYLASV
jgi:hypothetical protein